MTVLGVVSFLACIEKIYSITNLVSVEKDWVGRSHLRMGYDLLIASIFTGRCSRAG
jgi:hypothetical protein